MHYYRYWINSTKVCFAKKKDQKEDPVAQLDEELLTVHEVAQRLRVDDTTVRRWIKNGVLEAIALPHRGLRQAYRIRKSTLDTLLMSAALPVGAE
jgi:excisionase family DNA binding protein